MSELTDSVVHMIDQLSRLPGIGRKSAERLAYHILRVNKSEALARRLTGDNAIRTVVRAAGVRDGVDVDVEFLD